MSNISIIGPLRLPLIVAIALVFAFAGCGGQDASPATATQKSSVAATATIAPATQGQIVQFELKTAPTATPSTLPGSASVPSTPATATPSPTQTPRSAGAKAPADYTDEEIAEIAETLAREFMDAINSQPEPDLERAKMTYSEACQPDADEFETQITALLFMLDGRDISIEVTDVQRFEAEDDGVLIKSVGFIDGEEEGDRQPSLVVFENGRWLDSDCDEGRRQFFSRASFGGPSSPSVTGPTATAVPVASVIPTAVPSAPVVKLSGDPGDHTDEQIARSVEAVAQAAWRALLADPPLDLDAVRSLSVEECHEPTDDELVAFAKVMNSQFGSSRIETKVLGIERVDDTRAWISGYIKTDGVVTGEVTPSLVVFEDGQWRDADCLPERDASLKRPDQIESIQRTAFRGEPVELQHDWEEPPYELIVMGPLEMTGDDTARLPVRVTAITDVLDLDYVFFWGLLSNGYNSPEDEAVWGDVECDGDVFEPVVLVRGGSREGFICFADDGLTESQPTEDRPFVFFESDSSDGSVRVDLTAGSIATERHTFEPDELWGIAPPALIGDTVEATYCYDADPWMGVTALSRAESVAGSDTMRVRARIMALAEGETDLSDLPVELASAPGTYGRIHVSYVEWQSPDGTRFPDSFEGVILEQGDTHEAFIYFRSPEDSPDSERYSLLVYRNCFASPVHLTKSE